MPDTMHHTKLRHPKHCGHGAKAREYWSAATARRMVDETLAAWENTFEALDRAWSSWADAAAAGARPGRRDYSSCCGEQGACRCHSCDHCTCCGCAEGADVLIEARVGERRVIPISLYNPRRRATTVNLDPGAWTSCSDTSVEISTTLSPSGAFPLGPCESRQVLVTIDVGSSGRGQQVPDRDDVRCCTVFTNDVQVGGCATVLRLAVAVLPSNCGALEVTCCGCGC